MSEYITINGKEHEVLEWDCTDQPGPWNDGIGSWICCAKPVDGTSEHEAARERVRAFLEARKKHRALDPEDIAGIGGNDGIAYLKVSDLELLVKEDGE